MARRAGLLAFTLLLLACSKPGPREAGRLAFDAAGCRACHKVGPVGGEVGPDLSLVGFRHNEDWLDVWLRDPHAWRPETEMPAFRLADGDRKAVVAFLASLTRWDAAWGPEPWKRGGEPAARGRILFNRAGCIACHGPRGEGGHPNNNVIGGAIPALPKLVATYTPGELRDKIAGGVIPAAADPSAAPPLVEMPAWGGLLSQEEIADVAAYLFTLAPETPAEEEW